MEHWSNPIILAAHITAIVMNPSIIAHASRIITRFSWRTKPPGYLFSCYVLPLSCLIFTCRIFYKTVLFGRRCSIHLRLRQRKIRSNVLFLSLVPSLILSLFPISVWLIAACSSSENARFIKFLFNHVLNVLFSHVTLFLFSLYGFFVKTVSAIKDFTLLFL